jgi:hypothetical protein
MNVVPVSLASPAETIRPEHLAPTRILHYESPEVGGLLAQLLSQILALGAHLRPCRPRSLVVDQACAVFNRRRAPHVGDDPRERGLNDLAGSRDLQPIVRRPPRPP